jgi:hypothetical protein
VIHAVEMSVMLCFLDAMVFRTSNQCFTC